MFILTICKQDGTVYWKETFNTLPEAMRWLNEEKTRPYWQQTFTYKIQESA